MPLLADSLVGRLQIVRLHPLTQRELNPESGHVGFGRDASGTPSAERSDFLDALFGDGFGVERVQREVARLAERIVAGGFPVALARPAGARRANWYRDYRPPASTWRYLRRSLPQISVDYDASRRPPATGSSAARSSMTASCRSVSATASGPCPSLGSGPPSEPNPQGIHTRLFERIHPRRRKRSCPRARTGSRSQG